TTTVSIGSQNVRLPVIQAASQALQGANYQFVRDLYQSYLKRPASATEVSVFGGYLNSGLATPGSLTAMVQSSQEYANVCTIWLHQVYKDMLGRDAGPVEIGNWVSVLRSPGLTMAAVAKGIAASPEATIRQWTGWVQAAYQGYLRRTAGPTEVAGWITLFQSGWTRDNMNATILSSPEYLGRFGTNTQFVTAMYSDVLGRPGSATAISAWVSRLQSGATRTAVVGSFVAGFEYHWHLDVVAVSQLYQGCLGRPAGNAEVVALAQALINGIPLVAIDVNVLSSQEYYNRAAANA